MLYLASRHPHIDRRRAWRVISFPSVDASSGNACADGDEAESHTYVSESGFDKISLQTVLAATLVITNYLLKALEVPKEILQFPDHEHSQTPSIR